MLESILYPFKNMLLLITCYSNHIKSCLPVMTVFLHIVQGGSMQFLLFLIGDAFFCVTIKAVFSISYFDKHQGITVVHDEVYLTPVGNNNFFQ